MRQLSLSASGRDLLKSQMARMGLELPRSCSPSDESERDRREKVDGAGFKV